MTSIIPKRKNPADNLRDRSDAFLRALSANPANDAILRDSAARILLVRAGVKPSAPAPPPPQEPGSQLEYQVAMMLHALGIPLAALERQPTPIQIAEDCQYEPDLGFKHPLNGRRVIVEVKGEAKGARKFGDESRVKFKVSSRLNPDWWFLWVKRQCPSTRITKAGKPFKKNPFLIELWSNGRCMRPNCANLAEALGLNLPAKGKNP